MFRFASHHSTPLRPTHQGTFTLSFRGQTTEAIAYNAVAATVKSALESLNTIYTGAASGDLIVTIGNTNACDSDGNTVVVTFKTTCGDLPMIRIATTALTGGTVVGSVAQTTQGTREDLVCNGRGACDYSTGLCACYSITTSAKFLSSNGYQAATNAAGPRGDCGWMTVSRASPFCPGTTQCNDHGTCDMTVANSVNIDLCSCYDGYTGGDCALRTCPSGNAWWDEPYPIVTISATDTVTTAHKPAECSNMGLCDRSTGVCACAAGFEGQACERTKCKDSCNNQGSCLSNRELAKRRSVNGVLTATSYGASEKPDTWDADKLFGCHCDQSLYSSYQPEAGGPSCKDLYCPTGDNPMTRTWFNTALTPDAYVACCVCVWR